MCETFQNLKYFLHSVFPCEDFKLTILIGFCFQLIISVPFILKKKKRKQAKLQVC